MEKISWTEHNNKLWSACNDWRRCRHLEKVKGNETKKETKSSQFF